MDLNFSSKIKEVISFSRQEASRLGNPFLAPEHLMLGLLNDTNNKAVRLLDQLKVDVENVRFQLGDDCQHSRQAARPILDGDAQPDESMLLEHAGIPVTLVMGEETNLKITRPEDLALAEIIMQRSLQNDNPSPDAPDGAAACRIGHGFDAHRLVEGRKLVLGGIEIDYELGLAGHSDADVLTHALCDAILGALGAGDIGSHFPDNDSAFKDIYSIKLLDRTIELARKKGYRIGNADITVVCQKPKLAPHIPRMKEVLAKSCQAPEDAINLKATTTEKMGYTGRGEGISCHAVVLLTSAN